MKWKLVFILISMVFLGAGIYISGRMYICLQFSRQVSELFNQAGNPPVKIFRYSDIKDLPLPVQRYFKHVLKEGQQYVSYARLRHRGTFRPGLDKGWIDIKGEQYFTASRPGFIWKGETSLFTARDMYINGRGSLKVTLLSLLNIVDASGAAYDQGELLRWLGECVWFPTALLPSEYISWKAIDSSHAMLQLRYNDRQVYYTVTFNEHGEIAQFETKRYMDSSRLETWIGIPSEYKEFHGIIIPSRIEGMWRLGSGDFSYARFVVNEIEYNVPVEF